MQKDFSAPGFPDALQLFARLGQFPPYQAEREQTRNHHSEATAPEFHYPNPRTTADKFRNIQKISNCIFPVFCSYTLDFGPG